MFMFALIIAIFLFVAGTSVPRLQTPLRSLAAVVVLIGLVLAAAVTVPAGHVGVLTLFGKSEPDVLQAGLHFINPLKVVHRMNVRTTEVFEHSEVPSKEGLTVGLEVSLIYHLEPSRVSDLYRTVGENYVNVIAVPQLRSAIRNVTVNHEAKDLYTSGREVISSQIQEDLTKSLATRGLVVENILLRKISLPDQVQGAINNKLAAEQEAERMKFVIQKETQEATRKKIEGQGISDFQNVVAKGIDERLLRWKALETVNELAKSANSKFVILGDRSGLPIIISPEK